jgi:hypothetical protein
MAALFYGMLFLVCGVGTSFLWTLPNDIATLLMLGYCIVVASSVVCTAWRYFIVYGKTSKTSTTMTVTYREGCISILLFLGFLIVFCYFKSRLCK